jgi:23S rRNA G2445 N2-methylase RlmL
MQPKKISDQSLFPLLILTPKGLGEVCAHEIQRISELHPEAGIDELDVMSTGVQCQATMAGIMLLNLMLRTASRVLVRLIEGLSVAGETATRQAAMDAGIHLDWMSCTQSFAVESSVTETDGLSQQYLALLIKDGICDAFRATSGGKRPNVDRANPDIRIFAKVERGRLWLSVDTSGRPLHQRGYRTPIHEAPGNHDAPMKEQLAAGILAHAGWQDFCWHVHECQRRGVTSPFVWNRVEIASAARGTRYQESTKPRRIPISIEALGVLAVPMCGSGTIAIEGALMLKNRYVRKTWQDFGFSQLLPFAQKEQIQTQFAALTRSMENSELSLAAIQKTLSAMHTQSQAQPASPLTSYFVLASDNQPTACELTRRSARLAGVDDIVNVTEEDFNETDGPGAGALVVLNPPYEKRMHSGMGSDYRWIGDTLKHRYTGAVTWIVSANGPAMKTVGLRPTRNVTVYNGALESKLCQYILYRAGDA